MISLRRAAAIGRKAGLASGVLLAGVTATSGLFGQSVADNNVPAVGLNIPSNLQIFGKLDPNVRKPTAIVNEAVITGTDVDQRVGLIIAANQLTTISPEDRERLKLQVLRGLIDETLQIQEAKANEITVSADEINQSYERVARNFGKSVPEMRVYMRQIGSSDRSLRRQIEAELAWSRFLRRTVEPRVNVGDEEIKAIIDRLQRQKGSEEFHLKEIYLSAGPDRAQQIFANARQMIQDIQKGEKPFEYYAQFSEASTRSTGGDLDWLSASQLHQLPDSLSSAAESMKVGEIVGPIEVPGGFSILYLVDKRKVLEADARDAMLTLKQISVKFPAGTTKDQATARVASFAKATQDIRGCGDVAKVAATLGAEVVDNASVQVRALPTPLQDIMLKLQIGQSTPPFGSVQDGIRSLVLCGRDDPKGGNLPGTEALRNKMEQERVNLRAQQMLRDLRRDAVVEYR